LVVDASAILAVVHEEPGHERVRSLLVGAAVSGVNLSEAGAKLLDRNFGEAKTRERLDELLLDVHPFDRDAAFAAASLRPLTRHLGLSFADRACLALALRLSLPVLTGDRAWAGLTIGLDIRLFR
jgi:PIN domain nuclease of toxin-antitoxin system